MNHATVHEDFFVDRFRWPEPVHYLGAGYLSVMVFFCISGYVIAISNDQNVLDKRLYIKRRLVRLYPAYIIAILLCLIYAGRVPLLNVLENLLFLQSDSAYWHLQIPIINPVTWSLNYEVVYYILFIPLFFIKPKTWQLLLGMLLLSVWLINANANIQFLVNYLNGFYFWILGLLIGWKIIAARDKAIAVPLLSLIFLQLCQQYLGVGVIILHVFRVNSNTNFNWLFDLPFCLMVMGVLTQKDDLLLRINKFITYAIPAVIFIYLLLNNRIFEDTRWVMCLIFWICSLIFYSEKNISAFILNKLTFVGKISYALYLVHIPIAFIVKNTVFIHVRPLEIVVKYFLWLIITFAVAILLDLKFQPAIKKYFFHS